MVATINSFHHLRLCCKALRLSISISENVWEDLARGWLGFQGSSLPSEYPSWGIMFQVRPWPFPSSPLIHFRLH